MAATITAIPMEAHITIAARAIASTLRPAAM
jgi:hypothetical protein